MIVTILLYVPLTIGVTEWRGRVRKKMNQLDNDLGARATDMLLNYETVRVHDGRQALSPASCQPPCTPHHLPSKTLQNAFAYLAGIDQQARLSWPAPVLLQRFALQSAGVKTNLLRSTGATSRGAHWDCGAGEVLLQRGF